MCFGKGVWPWGICFVAFLISKFFILRPRKSQDVVLKIFALKSNYNFHFLDNSKCRSLLIIVFTHTFTFHHLSNNQTNTRQPFHFKLQSGLKGSSDKFMAGIILKCLVQYEFSKSSIPYCCVQQVKGLKNIAFSVPQDTQKEVHRQVCKSMGMGFITITGYLLG